MEYIFAGIALAVFVFVLVSMTRLIVNAFKSPSRCGRVNIITHSPDEFSEKYKISVDAFLNREQLVSDITVMVENVKDYPED